MNGKIGLKELKAALGPELSDVDEKVWMSILHEADINNDGEVDIEDFFKMMSNLQEKAKPTG